MRLVRRVFWAIVFLIAAIFAVINLQTVEVVIDPFGLELAALRPIYIPLAYVIFVSVALGLILGVLLENDRGRPARRELRDRRAEVARLKAETERMHRAMKDADHPDSAGLPVRR